MKLAATFCKNVCLVACTTPFTKIIYILTSPPASLWENLRAIWNTASQARVLILPQIKLNSQLLLGCAYFLSWQRDRTRFSSQYTCGWRIMLQTKSALHTFKASSLLLICPRAKPDLLIRTIHSYIHLFIICLINQPVIQQTFTECIISPGTLLNAMGEYLSVNHTVLISDLIISLNENNLFLRSPVNNLCLDLFKNES